MLNHPLPIKLDRDNHILWHTQMENVIYANGFEDHIEGLSPCPLKTISTDEVNLDFLDWRKYMYDPELDLLLSHPRCYGPNCWAMNIPWNMDNPPTKLLCFHQSKNNAIETFFSNNKKRPSPHHDGIHLKTQTYLW